MNPAQRIRRRNFINAVMSAAKIVGFNTAAVTEHVLRPLFPETTRASVAEGAYKMFRAGVQSSVRQILKGEPDGEDPPPAATVGVQGDPEQPSPDQIDMESIDPSFRPYVAELHHVRYYVESLDEMVEVERLVKNLYLLGEARDYLQRKGDETIAEADLLDRLYKAVARHVRRATRRNKRRDLD